MTIDDLTGSDSFSDTPIFRVLDAVPPAVAAVLRRLLSEPAREVATLREEIRSYVQELRDLNRDVEFLDFDLARQVATRCEALLDGITPASPPEIHRLVQAAVRYFIENDDEENDIESPIGFDYDAEVVNLVARAIGREDVLELETPGDS